MKLLAVSLVVILAIGVSQDLTPIEQQFIDLLNAGENVTLTEGRGISIWNGVAYGEEATIQVPFDYSGQSGTFFEFETYYQYMVKFTGDKDAQPPVIERDPISDYLPLCTDINLVYDEETDRCITETQLEEEAIEDYEAIIPTVPAPTREEIAIANYKKGEPTPLEIEIISLLEKERSVCLIDVLTIQTYGELQVPIEIFTDADGNISLQLVRNYIQGAYDQKNHPIVSKILRDIEFCRAQISLEYITGPQYENMVVDDEFTPRFDHRDTAIGLETHPVPQLNDESFIITQGTAQDTICGNKLFPENVKRDYGCYPVVEYYGGAPIQYQSEAEQAYLRYLNDGDSEQFNKMRKAVIQDKLRELFR